MKSSSRDGLHSIGSSISMLKNNLQFEINDFNIRMCWNLPRANSKEEELILASSVT